MIAKAKAVAHGIRAMLYVSGESRNKKHPERIIRICDNFMPQGMDATGIFTEMKFATMNHPNIKNNIIRMEISPAMEHTENFTLDDWRELWHDFAAAFDMQEIRDKDGKVVSEQTNISGSKSSVWLHEESDSRIPHRQPDGRKREHQQRPRHTPPRTTGGGNDSPAKGMDYGTTHTRNQHPESQCRLHGSLART